MTPLPRLELSDHHRSQFDEAVIIVGDREEETITIACEGALDLADRLIRLVNNHERVVRTLIAAGHALRSYEFGNGAPDLAQSMAADCEQLSKTIGVEAA